MVTKNKGIFLNNDTSTQIYISAALQHLQEYVTLSILTKDSNKERPSKKERKKERNK
jgi:hypothetical protein